MDIRQEHALSLRDTDIQGAVRRCGNNEELYIACLMDFLNDTTMSELKNAISNSDWDEAFTAAHALKGLAGNMGFVPLMHSTGQLVVIIRGGRLSDIEECMNRVSSSYRDITDAIKENFTEGSASQKGENDENTKSRQ